MPFWHREDWMGSAWQRVALGSLLDPQRDPRFLQVHRGVLAQFAMPILSDDFEPVDF